MIMEFVLNVITLVLPVLMVQILVVWFVYLQERWILKINYVNVQMDIFRMTMQNVSNVIVNVGNVLMIVNV